MFHIAGYQASADQASLAAISAIADPVLTVSGDNIQVPTAVPTLGMVFAFGVSLTRAQMQSPSLRRLFNPEVRPINRSATPLDPLPIWDMMTRPIPLDAGEQIQAYTSEDGAGATQMGVILAFADKAIAPSADPYFTIRATASQTLTAYAWTNAIITLDQVLPVGTYAIVGARAESTGGLAFRFVFQNQTPRPGGIMNVDALGVGNRGQRSGNWGEWGTFDNTTIPTVDFLSGSADTSEVLAIDLVKKS